MGIEQWQYLCIQIKQKFSRVVVVWVSRKQSLTNFPFCMNTDCLSSWAAIIKQTLAWLGLGIWMKMWVWWRMYPSQSPHWSINLSTPHAHQARSSSTSLPPGGLCLPQPLVPAKWLQQLLLIGTRTDGGWALLGNLRIIVFAREMVPNIHF